MKTDRSKLEAVRAVGNAKVKKRYYLLLVYAAFHLFMVVLGAWQIQLLPASTYLSRTKELYQAYTGADSGYEFFAPEVGTQLRAIFEIVDEDGRKLTSSLERGIASEADLRVGNIVNMLFEYENDPVMKRSLVASWAGRMFGRYPNAKQVVVKVQEYYLPSMQDFRAGDKPYWKDYYVATFQARS